MDILYPYGCYLMQYRVIRYGTHIFDRSAGLSNFDRKITQENMTYTWPISARCCQYTDPVMTHYGIFVCCQENGILFFHRMLIQFFQALVALCGTFPGRDVLSAWWILKWSATKLYLRQMVRAKSKEIYQTSDFMAFCEENQSVNSITYYQQHRKRYRIKKR